MQVLPMRVLSSSGQPMLETSFCSSQRDFDCGGFVQDTIVGIPRRYSRRSRIVAGEEHGERIRGWSPLSPRRVAYCTS
jgi:hypothetical protein